MLKSTNNITLENVKKSNYWDLISILVWNHYSEKHYQDETKLNFKEIWVGKSKGVTSHNKMWNDPNHKEGDLVRTLDSILIIFERDDYITYIYIHADGNVNCFGMYTDKEKKQSPHYNMHSNLHIINWMINNNFIENI